MLWSNKGSSMINIRNRIYNQIGDQNRGSNKKSSTGGTMKTEEILVRENLPLVYKIVGSLKYSKTIRTEDLVQEGTLALLMSLRKFDSSLGYAFSTYAYRTIWGSLKNYLTSNTSSLSGIRGKYGRIKKEDRTSWLAQLIPCSLDTRVEMEDGYSRMPLSEKCSTPADFTEEVDLNMFLETILTLKQQTHLKLLLAGYSAEEIAKKMDVTRRIEYNARCVLHIKLRKQFNLSIRNKI
jgi:RNA polymerase sigma factor (sigma-70 family)